MTENKTLLQHAIDAGFPLASQTIIHLFIGGSQLHGAKIAGYDDLDIYGVYVEPPMIALGLAPMPHYVWSSGAPDTHNTADDVDLTMYSLRRWAELAMKGNPSILHFLFAESENTGPHTSIWRQHILPHRQLFLSLNSAAHYLGFAENQRLRMTGERGQGRHGQRLDLVEKFGYDVKFAMHYLRLLYECRELLRDRHLTLPRPEPERSHLIAVRSGVFSLDEVLNYGLALKEECSMLLARSSLPETPNADELSRIISKAHLEHWNLV